MVTEVEAARQLCQRAVDSLAGTEPQEGISPALKAVSQVLMPLSSFLFVGQACSLSAALNAKKSNKIFKRQRTDATAALASPL